MSHHHNQEGSMCRDQECRNQNRPSIAYKRNITRDQTTKMSVHHDLRELQDRRRPANRRSLYCIFICLVAVAMCWMCNSIFAYNVASRSESEQRAVGILSRIDDFSKQKEREPRQFSQTLDIAPFASNRSIVLIHVGKAGGLTIRENLAHTCNFVGFGGSLKRQERKRQKCKDRLNRNGGLSLQTQSVFHGQDYNGTAVKESTTFVITLRNPIDRIVSAYRYSHPSNCIGNNETDSPEYNIRGCQLLKEGLLETRAGFKIFKQCFPDPAMEDFAQILMNPYKASRHMQTLPNREIRECHRIARGLLAGIAMDNIIPHMQYTYRHYFSNTILLYPEKEVFGIRTEHQFADMELVDKWVGGKGKAWNRDNPFTHGSQHFAPSPLSVEATNKLCCTLSSEIEVYLDIFDKAINLDLAAKREAEDRLRQQCGLSTDVSWREWQTLCEIGLSESIESSLENTTALPTYSFYPQQAEVAQNRSIVLVHVGKAGGMTLRNTLAFPCATGRLIGSSPLEEQQEICTNKYQLGQRLSLQTRSVFHVDDYDPVDMKKATTYLFTLRNPVERVISAYRFSHPDNCGYGNNTDDLMRGCTVIQYGHLDNPLDMAQCFPSAAMEDFAQSLIPPWRPTPSFQNLTQDKINDCRRYALAMVQRSSVEVAIPQMHFNYLYYYSGSVKKFPDKEVFAVRTEHEWEDIVTIDKWIGGTGKYPGQGGAHTHGSEHYRPSPLSEEAYHKLCCVLASEIKIYFHLYDLALNLDEAAKLESEDILREKCGIPASTSWTEWRNGCNQRLADVDSERSVAVLTAEEERTLDDRLAKEAELKFSTGDLDKGRY
ncbi:expressed unknown protein [Seminavis robusta]|uniref:Uncharacterized protein n=1 Tax=Seminavis robusta TaxID=568900 RepID=A0A9N8DJ68_9STRA|nr:expressed unknown protein [Seminavis robusta]|eukprot:Sro89_g046940.1 n/a (828) ;mRNA; f:60096-62859